MTKHITGENLKKWNPGKDALSPTPVASLSKTQQETMNLPDTPDGTKQRIAIAKELLGSLTTEQEIAVIEAHKCGKPPYSQVTLKHKVEILQRAGMQMHQIDALMRAGVTGSVPENPLRITINLTRNSPPSTPPSALGNPFLHPPTTPSSPPMSLPHSDKRNGPPPLPRQKQNANREVPSANLPPPFSKPPRLRPAASEIGRLPSHIQEGMKVILGKNTDCVVERITQNKVIIRLRDGQTGAYDLMEFSFEDAARLLEPHKNYAPLPSEFSRHAPERVSHTPSAVLDGGGRIGLEQNILSTETPGGDRIAGSTDSGIGYKPVNEDRVVINSQHDFAAVIDGVGGHSGGDKAAQILAEELQRSPNDIYEAVARAQRRMESISQNVHEPPGAVFISSRVVRDSAGRKFLEVAQAGDAGLIVVDKRGRVKFRSRDESVVQTFLENGTISDDEALYHSKRNIVTNSIHGSSGQVTQYDRIPLENGDRIFLYSDGIGDNLTPEEIVRLAPSGTSVEQAIRSISDVTGQRMQRAKMLWGESERTTGDRSLREARGSYSDGYLSEPKPDNRALAIIDVGEGRSASHPGVERAANGMSAAERVGKYKSYFQSHEVRHADRLEAARTLLARPLTSKQVTAILDAHNLPGTIDHLNPSELRAKTDKLKSAGFTEEERRLLIEAGICGAPATAILRPPPSPPPRKPKKERTSVSGQIAENLKRTFVTPEQVQAARTLKIVELKWNERGSSIFAPAGNHVYTYTLDGETINIRLNKPIEKVLKPDEEAIIVNAFLLQNKVGKRFGLTSKEMRQCVRPNGELCQDWMMSSMSEDLNLPELRKIITRTRAGGWSDLQLSMELGGEVFHEVFHNLDSDKFGKNGPYGEVTSITAQTSYYLLEQFNPNNSAYDRQSCMEGKTMLMQNKEFSYRNYEMATAVSNELILRRLIEAFPGLTNDIKGLDAQTASVAIRSRIKPEQDEQVISALKKAMMDSMEGTTIEQVVQDIREGKTVTPRIPTPPPPPRKAT